MTPNTEISGLADLSDTDALWVLIRPPNGDYYLTTRRPVVVAPDGTWTTSATVGQNDGTGASKSFDLLLVAAPAEGSALAEWVRTHPRRHGPFAFLPGDATTLDQVTVRLPP